APVLITRRVGRRSPTPIGRPGGTTPITTRTPSATSRSRTLARQEQGGDRDEGGGGNPKRDDEQRQEAGAVRRLRREALGVQDDPLLRPIADQLVEVAQQARHLVERL